ncbi:MAG TPA: galactose oxidase-like domain-containing protein [Chloroflexota bacterium]|nr:galactose oxidase-like domain-containing protein [Chloroflexota bacterium]
MPTTHSGFLIQSTHGVVGNLELVVASPKGGLAHTWRNNNAAGFPWIGPTFFGSGDLHGPSLIQSSLGGGAGTFQVVVREGTNLGLYERSDQSPFTWYGPLYFASGVSGNPALVQSQFGTAGNFELVVPVVDGGLAHYSRDNDDPALPWSGPTIFATGLGQVEAVALVHSTFGVPGTLDLIARVGDQLFHLWRDPGPAFTWSEPVPVFAGAAGIPGFIQSRFGNHGHFELVTPLATGGMAHLWRDNDDPALPWSAPVPFGQAEGQISAVSLVHGTIGTPGLGNFELVARVGERNAHYYREDQPPFLWHGPSAFAGDEPVFDPGTEGEWRVPYGSGVVGVHAAQLHTGKVLFFSYDFHEHDTQGGDPHGESAVLDPQTGQVSKSHLEKNLFCSGHGFLPDGRLVVAGGADTGVKALHCFTPNAESGAWQDLGDMPDGRWYPTCACLPDGRLLIMSGSHGGPRLNPHTGQIIQETPLNETYAILDAGGLQAPVPAPVIAAGDPYSLFPFVFVLPSGKLLVHVGTSTHFLDLTTWTFDDTTHTTHSPIARLYPSTGTCVLLPLLPQADPPYRARLLLIGGAGVAFPQPAEPTTPATETCELLDLGLPAPAWQPAAPMPLPRVMPDAVLLPDGTVFVTNGSSTGVADNGINPVFPAVLYDPVADTWSTMASMRVPRLYHSTALLLPDGRVLTAGKDERFNPPPFNYPEYRIEVFSPPYLFRGPRPTIAAAPTSISYNTPFVVQTPDAPQISAAALLRPGSATHSFNPDQRYVGLAIAAGSSASVTLMAPPDGNVAPPGHYMLFLLDGAGVPSVAAFLHLG